MLPRMVDFLSGPERIALNPGAAMQQIADWLEKLGMSEYVEFLPKIELTFRSFLT